MSRHCARNLLLALFVLTALTFPPAPALAEPADPDLLAHIELAGQLGGFTQALAIVGHTAYISSGPRILAIDITDPQTPRFLGQSQPLSDLPEDIAIVGHYAYVAAGKSIWVVSLADPGKPQLGSRLLLSSPVSRLLANQGYLYAGEKGSPARIISLANPTLLQDMGTIAGTTTSPDMLMFESNLYIAEESGGIIRYDTTSPGSPIDIMNYNAAGAAGLAILNSFVYVVEPGTSQTAGTDFEIIALDNPTYRAKIHLSGVYTRVALVGNSAALMDRTQGAVVVDVTDPAKPALVSNKLGYDSGAYAMQVVNSLAYIASGSRGLRIFQFDSPTSQTEVGRYETLGFARNVASNPPYLYIGGFGGSGSGAYRTLTTTNMLRPQAPLYLGDIGNKNQFTSTFTAIAAGKLYAIDQGGSRLDVFSLAKPDQPALLGSYTFSGRVAIDLIVLGSYAYAAISGKNELDVLNVSQPASITLALAYVTTAPVAQVEGLGNRVYIDAGGLTLLDVTTPAAPVKMASLAGKSGPFALSGDGNTVYLVDASKRFNVIDTTNPGNFLIRSFIYVSSVTDLITQGNYVYMVMGSNLSVIDVTDPLNPRFSGSFGPLAETTTVHPALAVDGTLVYVAGWSAGLYMIYVSIPVMGDIAPTGGTLVSAFDQVTYTFPSGSFSATTTITHTPIFAFNLPANGKLTNIGAAYQVSAVSGGADVQPLKPYTVKIHYPDPGSVSESTLALYGYNGSTWEKASTNVVDAAHQTLTATVDHFSTWAVFGEETRLFLPLLQNVDSGQ